MSRHAALPRRADGADSPRARSNPGGAAKAGGQSRSGFTLIEVLTAITLSVIVLGAIFFSLNAAFESWRYSKNELALQQVMTELMDSMLTGTDWTPGLQASLEITEADADEVTFVSPWVEERPVLTGGGAYELQGYLKPGAALPAVEYRLPDGRSFQAITVAWENPDSITEHPRFRPHSPLAPGGTIRFVYHPDPDRVPEAVASIRWDRGSRSVILEQIGSRETLSRNPFGITITECAFRYFDHTNAPVTDTEGAADIPDPLLPVITAVGLELTGEVEGQALTLPGMVMLRNSARQSGLVLLREGLRVSVPDSRTIASFLLTNLSGLSSEDILQLELRPKTGQIYRVTITFEEFIKTRPVIGQIRVEYPPGHPVLTERPRTDPGDGLDLLALGQDGNFDYDDDSDIDDAVMVEGDPVTLAVTKMDIRGAACFIRP
ncbi:MAG TPA: prepilin-type N-terminal cleavage/methylation domain-containing protein [bacterium]